jgi:hypothetical protein
MKTSKNLDNLLLVAAVVVPFTAVLYGCGSSKSRSSGSGFVQVERLGRPAINEGLVVTNAFLNAYNSIAPSQDITVLTDPVNAPFLAEVNANLDAVDGLVAPAGDVQNGDVIQAFLPDVMRVDTSRTIALATSAYADGALAVGTAPRPISGRKLTDDVVDITLTVLGSPFGAQGPISDNVDYRDAVTPTPDGAGQVDHDLLFGQTTVGGGADFPYLPAPN